jgi:hypothetical protein
MILNKKHIFVILSSLLIVTSVNIPYIPYVTADVYGPNGPNGVGTASGSFTNSGSATAVQTIDGTVWGQGSNGGNAAMKGTEGQTVFVFGLTPLLSETLTQVDVLVTSAVTPSGTQFVVTAQLYTDTGLLFGDILSTPLKTSTDFTTDTISFTSANGWAAAGFDITDTDGSAFGVQIRISSYTDGGSADSALVDAVLITLHTEAGVADVNEGIGQNNMWIFALGATRFDF